MALFIEIRENLKEGVPDGTYHWRVIPEFYAERKDRTVLHHFVDDAPSPFNTKGGVDTAIPCAVAEGNAISVVQAAYDAQLAYAEYLPELLTTVGTSDEASDLGLVLSEEMEQGIRAQYAFCKSRVDLFARDMTAVLAGESGYSGCLDLAMAYDSMVLNVACLERLYPWLKSE